MIRKLIQPPDYPLQLADHAGQPQEGSGRGRQPADQQALCASHLEVRRPGFGRARPRRRTVGCGPGRSERLTQACMHGSAVLRGPSATFGGVRSATPASGFAIQSPDSHPTVRYHSGVPHSDATPLTSMSWDEFGFVWRYTFRRFRLFTIHASRVSLRAAIPRGHSSICITCRVIAQRPPANRAPGGKNA